MTREVTATGTTVAAAERALREKLVDRATPTQQAITADTTIAKLASLWLKYLRDEDRIETTTINEYERVLTKVVIPELGGLRASGGPDQSTRPVPRSTPDDEREPPTEDEGGDGRDDGLWQCDTTPLP